MKWRIPSKTFLLGEYAAIAEASAIILNTGPYFELCLTNTAQRSDIHPQSPAGLWWQRVKQEPYGLSFEDPYQGLGGLGASSAQFLGSYLAGNYLNQSTPTIPELLEAYYESAWSGVGLRPSGYDVIAQSQQGCVYINKQNNSLQSYPWPFKELSFLLLHTKTKLATHHHLQQAALPACTDVLSLIVDEAREAFEQSNSEQLIHAINLYQHHLNALNLLAPHSLELIEQLKTNPKILAIKGCGALGADVLLLITSKDYAPLLKHQLIAQNTAIIATEADVTSTSQAPLIKPKINASCPIKK